jgi:hypothetical protein
MWSYPNFVPLSAREVERIAVTLQPWPFDRLYGAFWSSVVEAEATSVVKRSAERYVRQLTQS